MVFRNMRRQFIFGFLLFWSMLIMAQAKRPTLMVMPANSWCAENGYLLKTSQQGATTQVADYETALNNSIELVAVITKIGELMADRGFPLKDLSQTIKTIHQNEAEDEMMTSSTSGAVLAENPIDTLLKRAKADIILELAWKVNKTGPRNSVTYILRALDAYTNKQVAASQGTGTPSISAEVPVLLQEAVLENMDNFNYQLLKHFDDLINNGREVTIGIRVFDNGSSLSFESEYGEQELSEIIEQWMAQHTVASRFNLTDATEAMMNFEQVRIPLYKENGQANDTRNFVNELRKYLRSSFGITSKIVTKGLGRADLILGEK